jgi:hypothetical protein
MVVMNTQNRSWSWLPLWLVTLAVTLTACAGSELVNLWKDPVYPEKPMTNMMIIALEQDPARRRMWEDRFVARLAKRNVTATPSYRLFEQALPDTQQVIEAVRAKGFDGVLVTHKLQTKAETRYVPGYTTTEPVTLRSPWSGWYHTYYTDVYHPGYAETDSVVSYETHVWSTQDGGRMVWAGTSQTVNPSSSEEVNREISKLIVPELSRMRVIPDE